MITTQQDVVSRSRLRRLAAVSYPGSSPLRSAVPVIAAKPWASRGRRRLDALPTAAAHRAADPFATATRVQTVNLVPTQAVGMVPGRRIWSPPV